MSDKKVSSILREIARNPSHTQDEMNDLRYILAHILGTEKAKLILHTDRELTATEFQAWEQGRQALIAQKNPVHYIINSKNFMGLDFFVDERVLIPRFDTEILVEATLMEIEKLGQELAREKGCDGDEDIDIDGDEDGAPSVLRVLELCTGSGAIPISIIHHQKLPMQVTALDISAEALQVAEINRQKLLNPEEQKKLQLIQSDLFEKIDSSGFHLILANPPYVTHREYATLDEKVKKEPAKALVAEDDGLFFYDKILKEGKKYLHPEKGTIIFEIGSQQGPALLALAKTHGYQDAAILPDYAGHHRVAIIRPGGDASFRSTLSTGSQKPGASS